MKRLRLFALAVLLPAAGHAETVCPYLNTATAGGILNASVTVLVTDVGATDDATCEFTRTSPDATLLLRIEVKTMSNIRKQFAPFLAQCNLVATKLRGIGNEAVACSGTADDGRLFDQVLSRVRERSLLVRVTSTDGKAEHTTLRDRSSKVAEQVAGNLF